MFSIRFLPLTLFLIILGADQLTRIPAVLELGRPEKTPAENMASVIGTIMKDYSENKFEKPMILFLGSSRSRMFQYMSPSLIESETELHEARLLKKYYYEARTAVLRSDAFLMLVCLEEVLKSDRLPEKIILEFSPELLNRHGANNMVSHFYPSIFPQSLLLSIAADIPDPVRGEIIARLLFHSYSVKFRPDTALSSILYGKDAELQNIGGYYLGTGPVKELPADFRDVEDGKMSESDYTERIKNYNNFLLKDLALDHYAADPGERKVYLKMQDKIAQSKVPVTVWIPKVHSSVLEIWKEKGLTDEVEKIKNEAVKRNANIVDMNRESKCERFQSSVLQMRAGFCLYNSVKVSEKKSKGAVCSV